MLSYLPTSIPLLLFQVLLLVWPASASCDVYKVTINGVDQYVEADRLDEKIDTYIFVKGSVIREIKKDAVDSLVLVERTQRPGNVSTGAKKPSGEQTRGQQPTELNTAESAAKRSPHTVFEASSALEKRLRAYP